MVTGWNEWIAGRFGEPGRPVMFVDQFNQEFSRDIEPMKGGHGDSFYYQLVAGVRRFKGAAPLPRSSAARSIAIDGSFDQWRDVTPEYRDDAGDTAPRDHQGAGGLNYVDHSGRNDLVAFKVTRDRQNIHFYVRTRQPVIHSPRPGGLSLLIDVDRNHATGWEGYDYLLIGSAGDPDTWSVKRNTGGWNWNAVAPRPFPSGRQRVAHRRSPSGPWRRPGLSRTLHRIQVGRQRPTSRRYHGILHERRRRARGAFQLSSHARCNRSKHAMMHAYCFAVELVSPIFDWRIIRHKDLPKNNLHHLHRRYVDFLAHDPNTNAKL